MFFCYTKYFLVHFSSQLILLFEIFFSNWFLCINYSLKFQFVMNRHAIVDTTDHKTINSNMFLHMCIEHNVHNSMQSKFETQKNRTAKLSVFSINCLVTAKHSDQLFLYFYFNFDMSMLILRFFLFVCCCKWLASW